MEWTCTRIGHSWAEAREHGMCGCRGTVGGRARESWVFRLQPCALSDASQHPWSDVLTIVECEHVIGPTKREILRHLPVLQVT